MTTKEFNIEFDRCAKIAEAQSLAFDLGYEETYLNDNGDVSPYQIRLKRKIQFLVGLEWPEEVRIAYKQGRESGNADT